MNIKHSPVRPRFDLAVGLYLATLTAFLVGGFYPEGRLWGINWWGYWPGWVAATLFLAGVTLIIPCGIIGSIRGKSDVLPNLSGPKWWSLLGPLAISLLGLGLFYFLRAKTHFLGDGYGLLKLLASNPNNYVRTSELGESLVHLWVKLMAGGNAEVAALFSYQAVSISAGVILLAVLPFFVHRIFVATVDRALFVAGIATGGYMLLYFGYVENYSLLVLATIVYTLTGLLISLGRLNRWFVLPTVAAAIFFHVAGIVLLPGAIYLLISNNSFQKRMAGISPRLWVVLGAAPSLFLLWLFYYFYTTNYFFRFAIVPLVENRVTAEGYTLFSFNHLTDFTNLLLLLLPGLPVLLASSISTLKKKVVRQCHVRFLLISLVSSLGACFAVDPRLGMPRDWDLLSFAGVPMAVLLYYMVLNRDRSHKRFRTHAALSIALGLLVLLPRAFSLTSSEIAMAHFNSYSRLDKSRYLFSELLLKTYYEQRQDTALANRVGSTWYQRYPEKALFERATQAKRLRRYEEAIGLFRRVLNLNPSYANAYNNLGNCFRATGQLDSALEYHLIAKGLRPYNAITLYNLGLSYASLNDILRAEQVLLDSYNLDNTKLLTILALVSTYKQLGYYNEFQHFLKIAAAHADAPPMILKEMGDVEAASGERQKAVESYQKAINRGLDSTFTKQLLRQYPNLRR